MLNTIKFTAFVLLTAGVLSSCETDDVTPTVSLEASSETLDVSGGDVNVVARLNGPVKETVSVSVSYGGSAVAGTDYQNPPSQIEVPAESTTGFITLTGIETGDTTAKFIEVTMVSAENAILGSPASVTIDLIDCLGDADEDGVANCDDECPFEAGAVENNGCPWLGLIVNEVLYDPPAGDAGDSNGDGTRDPLEDEFVELYNDSVEIDISGYTLSDASQVRHIFPEGTIVPSRGVVVVFGGGAPAGAFGGAIVQTATEGQLNLNNAGDELIVEDADGNVIATFDINPLDGNPNEGYTRNPDIFGEFEKHSTIPEASGALYSPGTKLDGSNFEQ
ncbi:MAG: lamin tail domain-containing protein [Cryomorphaceae bacterium]